MKQQGKCITGDPVSVDNFTADWMSVRIHPTTFYRRQEEIHSAKAQEGSRDICHPFMQRGQTVRQPALAVE